MGRVQGLVNSMEMSVYKTSWAKGPETRDVRVQNVLSRDVRLPHTPDVRNVTEC